MAEDLNQLDAGDDYDEANNGNVDDGDVWEFAGGQ
jgi:hypothetical protein